MAHNPFNQTAKQANEWAKPGLFNFSTKNAQAAVEAKHDVLDAAFNAVQATPKGHKVDKVVEETFKDSARGFNNSVDALKYNQGKIGASGKGLVKSWFETLKPGSTEKWGATKIAGNTAEDVAKALENAKSVRGSLVERVISKPLRVAAKYPKISLVAVGALGVAGVNSALHARAARKTQQAAEQQALEAQQIPQAQAQANVSYKNSVSADEMAALEASFKANQTGQTGHAESVTAARQQPEAAAVAQL